MAFHLKLIQPKELPADKLTSAEFKPWQNHLTNFLQQDVENFNFLPGGKYSNWQAANETEGNKRIRDLINGDDDLAIINGSEDTPVVKNAKKVKLLNQRNAQLGRMLQHIVSFVHYTEADDIDQASTSVEWIFKYLKQHYNIEAKGSNFLKITEHTFKSGVSPQVFYKQFRAGFLNNLRKQGEVMTHKGGKVLVSDEVLTPSFEDAIVLWTLEKIDPRLPKKVRRDYEHRLTGSTYLIDLQVSIFQSIPTMLEEIDKQVEINALTAVDGGEDTTVSAINTFHRRPQSTRGGRGRGGSARGFARGPERRPFSRNFCRVCHAAGKEPQVYQSHNIGTCSFFDSRDKRDMYTSLRAMDLQGQGKEDDDDYWIADTADLEPVEGDQA